METVVIHEVAVLTPCLICGTEKYSTQPEFICARCYRSGAAGKAVHAAQQGVHWTGLESVSLEDLHAEVCRRRYVPVEPASQ